MGQRAKHQKALIMAAARLFRRKGYHGTSTAEILALSGAPRGSLYYYFPGGKEEIGAATVAAAARWSPKLWHLWLIEPQTLQNSSIFTQAN